MLEQRITIFSRIFNQIERIRIELELIEDKELYNTINTEILKLYGMLEFLKKLIGR